MGIAPTSCTGREFLLDVLAPPTLAGNYRYICIAIETLDRQ